MKPCVLIPTYDNPRTLAEVVRGALGQCSDVIVVDDGSGPETKAILAEFKDVVVMTHEANRGKGAALRTGLDEAHRRGFSHAVSMDSDGQHFATDIPRFFEEARAHPESLILGHRDLKAAGAGPGSRFGKVNSNFWTWILTGKHLPDTQTGFRCYPVGPMSKLALHCTKFDFEIETLVRGAWCDIELRSIPIGVRYFAPEDRVSHLRFVDYLRISHLNTRFCTQRLCLPPPYLRLRSQRSFHSQSFVQRWRTTFRKFFIEEQGSPAAIASAVGLGLFWGLAPVWGFQIVILMLCAHALGLSKPISLLAAHVSFPVAVPAILYASLVIGRLALGLPEGVTAPSDLEHLAPGDVQTWIVGSLLLATGVGLAGMFVSYLLIKLARLGSSTEASP
jgi:glycosyltransferase involved in cell wall biosynthesis